MNRVQFLAVGLAGGLALGGGIATAATKAPTSVKACVDKGGVLSLLNKGKCAKGQREFRLGVTGPRGLTGAAGTAGAVGPAGAAGTTGPAGAPGDTGQPGPSAVYGWSGQLHSASPASPEVTVPAGSYVVRWQGWVDDTSADSATVACDLFENGSGAGIIVTVASMQSQPDSNEDLITAATPFTIKVACTGLAPGVNLTDATLTATMTGALVATGVTTPS